MIKCDLIYLSKPMSWNQWHNKCEKDMADWLQSRTPVEVKTVPVNEFNKDDLRKYF